MNPRAEPTGAARAPAATGLRELLRFPSRLERRIAVRYLRSRRGRRGASLSTTISVGGIAEQPDVTALPSATSSSGRDYTPGVVIALLAVAGIVVGGWWVRKRAV